MTIRRQQRGKTAPQPLSLAPAGMRPAPRQPGNRLLLAGVSVGALLFGLTATPAAAQLAQMRGASGTLSGPSAGTVTAPVPVVPVTMQEALARQAALQTRAQALAKYVQSAHSATLASIPGLPPTDGISTNGLNPIAGVRAVTLFVAAGTNPATVVANAAPSSVAAANDPTGLNTWEGATAPVQSTSSTGKVTVTITQTQQNALLSWNNFDISANTALVFSQKSNGVAQPGWTVVNRVVGAVNPSKILGSITADGTVLILNSAGVIFGPTAQVNLNSLIVSSLELGNFASAITTSGQTQYFVASTIKDRNTAFLQNGLLVSGVNGNGTSYKGQILSALLAPGQYEVNQALPLATSQGSVTVDTGAQVTSGAGGFIIMAGPTVTNAGVLSATDGQVSLQGGEFIGATPSSGSATSIDPNVRGLVLASQVPNLPVVPPQDPTPDQGGAVYNYGLIESRRGYISLGTAIYGTVTNAGLLEATTSVSRNGKIALIGGSVDLAGSSDLNQASGIEILPDDNGETIPQGTPDSPPAFKTSQITIGDAVTTYLAGTSGDIALFPSLFHMEQNAFILAPSANVVIGQDASKGTFTLQPGVPSGVTIDSGARIDVAGEAAVTLDASVNSVEISPAKQNELRDTPNYRSVTTDGSFTLNGATLYVDAAASGVRSDGVVWQGSPLLEAGSAISQIPETAAQLMTKGGTISIDVGAQTGSNNLDAATVPAITIAKNAVFDISGGWVHYDAGLVVSSELVTSDGQTVNIANADPNGNYVAVVNGFTAAQPHFGISQTYYNAALQGLRYEAGYDEGRDAGALQVLGSQISFDGTIYAHAFAGANQLAMAEVDSAAQAAIVAQNAASAGSSISGDPRKLQYSPYFLPSGGLFRIGSFSGSSGTGLGQDIVVYDGTRGSAAANQAEILLNDQMLSDAGLSALMLQTSGAVTLASAADAGSVLSANGADPALNIMGTASLTLADGGTLEIDAGRSIRLDGNVRIDDGTIAARTYLLSTLLAAGVGSIGNPFRTDDDIALGYAPGSTLPHPFDLTVNGTLDVSGRWVNDYLGAANPQGQAWINGGTISLTVAPNAFVPLAATPASASVAGDLSGSLFINSGAMLNVSAGGYVSSALKFNLTGSGGNVSLIDQTTYATIAAMIAVGVDFEGTTVTGQGVAFTPAPASDTTVGVNPSLVVASQNSVVQFAPGSIKGYGFAGGGTFRLVSPDVAFNGTGGAGATQLPLDFLQKTGFGTLDITAYHSRVVAGLFDNGSAGLSSFFDTTRVVVGAGQSLDLTQVILPTTFDTATQTMLLGLPSGSAVASLFTAVVAENPWFQKAATLDLRGLMELDVEAGGSIVGAPQATIVTPKLYNAGTIDLPGGTISQVATLPAALNGTGIGLVDPSLGGTGFEAVFGAPDANGHYVESALNTAGLTNADGSVQTNNQIFTTPGSEHFFYFLGQVAANDGVVLTGGSITNLAGTAIYNPNAPLRSDGMQYQFGKLIGGGSITAAAPLQSTTDTSQALFSNPQYGYPAYPDPTSSSATPPPLLAQTAARQIIAEPGSTIDISGASANFDEPVSATTYALTPQWSDAGTLALRGGGTLSGATIKAFGGGDTAATSIAQATGGTLEWFDPTIRATDPCAGQSICTGAVNIAYADQITNSGFSTLIADGGLTLDGNFTQPLTLDKALLVRSAASLDGTAIGPNAAVVISATAGTKATIAAPYINFYSRSGSASTSGGSATGNGVVTFSAGASGMDIMGGILFDGSIGQLNLNSQADVRLIGVDDRADSSQLPVLDGSLIAAGNITFDAGRVYTTTGTGNLQRILEDAAGAADTSPPSPYVLEALGTSSITFLGDHINSATPLSAGSYLQIEAGSVEQDGYLATPLGRLAFGTADSPIASVHFGAGSITSVSGAGMNVPYGTTTDLSEYFFTPGTSSPITQLPSGDLTVVGSNIVVAKGSTVDGAGGGDVFAYEFVSGTGGSRDVLSRFNSDPFSANGYNPSTGVGYQYADQRQVYAIVPAAEAAKIALYDPVYSADYSSVPAADNNGTQGPTNLYGVNAGMAVTLDGGGGIPAGQYVLMPAHYALLQGAYRVVQNNGAAAPAPGVVQTLRDGSIVMGGVYSTAGTGLSQSQRVSFTLESQATFLKYSDIQTTSGTATVEAAAASAGIAVPRNPLDAARVVLDPLNSLEVSGFFDMAGATGGRGSEVDILGSDIIINHTGTSASGGLVLSDTTLGNLNANSLLIGGERTENADDTTTVGVTANRIVVAANAKLTVPELLLAVGGIGSRLIVQDGAQITTTGTLADTRAGDYIINSTTTPTSNDPFDESGVGSLLRVSNGPQRLVDRLGDPAISNANRNTAINIGAATLTGASLLVDTSHSFAITDTATLAVSNIGIEANNISFGSSGTIDATLEAKLANVDTLTLASQSAIGFDAGSTHQFNNLTLNAPGIALNNPSGGQDSLVINAKDVRIGNTRGTSPACGATGAPACTTAGNTLAINASSLTFTSGTFATYTFDGAVSQTATNGTYVEGAGALAVGTAALNLVTPFLIDRAAVVDPTLASTTPSDQISPKGNYTIPQTPNYLFSTTGAVSLVAPTLAAGAPVPTPQGIRTPGAHIAFGTHSAPVASLSIDGVAVTATAGVIDAESKGSITLANAASLSTPGFSRSYGDAQSTTTVSAGGGTVNLVSLTGDIVLPSTSAISVDNGVGNAGILNLLASEGAVTFDATLDSGVAGPRAASLTFDSQTAAFDLDGFATKYGTLFEGNLDIRSGVGDLTLGSGHTLAGSAVSLTADGGVIDIFGTISTAGQSIGGMTTIEAAQARVNGGDIALWGMNGVTLEAGSLLDTHTSGYADTDLRQASAGNVTIGIGDTGGGIAFDTGATINVSSTRTLAANAAGNSGNRLVPVTVKDPNTLVETTVYQFVAADTGGTVLLRAPVTGSNDGIVNIGLHGTVVGAASQQIEGYKTYNLDAIAAAFVYDGVYAYGNGLALDPTSYGDTFLSDYFSNPDGMTSIPYFIQNFAISAADGSDLSGWRQRPGVDLVSTGDVTLVAPWNLAAGTLDTAAAAAAGLLQVIPELGLRPDGTPYYGVVSGQEGNLLANYVSFVYRVGGKASGEAGVFTIQSGGNLDIAASISDGFFTFADKSDATWINYQLGGGDRTYDPALVLNCGSTGNCASIASYTGVAGGSTTAASDNTVTINLNKYYTGVQEGAALVVAPYDDAANSVTATGSNYDPSTGNVSGDPLGFAQLFPLLPDGTAINSSSLRLVAGTGAAVSADPLHVDRATAGNVTVEGETQYALTATAGNVYQGTGLSLKLAVPGTLVLNDPNYTLTGLLDTTDTTGNVNALASDSYTTINWGNAPDGMPADMRQAAQTYFAGKSATFVTNVHGIVTGVATPLSEMLAFLQSFAPTFNAGIAAQASGYPVGSITGAKLINMANPVAYVHTLVRTGDGSISVAAAGNVDLTNSDTNLVNYNTAVLYRNQNGVRASATNLSGEQVGGTAIYTAGVRVSPAAVMANIVGSGLAVSVAPDSPYIAIAAGQADFIPSTRGYDDQAAVLAMGGGDVSIAAGGDVLGRRDDWSERYLNGGVSYAGGNLTTYDAAAIGDASQRWAVGQVGQDTEIAIAPKYFTSGVGALAGGDVTITAGGDVSDLTVALDAGVTTTNAATAAGTSPVMMTLGRGDLTMQVGGNMLAGQIDVADGVGTIAVGGNVLGYGTERAVSTPDPTQYLRVRLADANFSLSADGSIAMAGVSALAAANATSATDEYNQAGFYTTDASFSAIATGSLSYADNRADQSVPFQVGVGGSGIFGGSVLPPTVTLAALTDTMTTPSLPLLLYPSAIGELNLFSAGDISSLVIAMSDSNPSLLPGAFSAARINLSSITATGSGIVTPIQGLGFGIPGVDPTTSDYLLRLYHDQTILHAGDTNPVHIFAGTDIANSLINLPKSVEIIAGRDITDLYFTGQNTSAQDTTLISAGRDIIGTTTSSAIYNLPYIVSSDYVLGGPGSFLVEAGRNIGPFINSAVVNGVSYPGGIQTVGNFYNPWLGAQGADLSVFFGVGNGIDYAALAQTYLDPANFAQLDGTLFAQTTDALGNSHPDRSQEIYTPILAAWLRDNAPDAFVAIFGAGAYPDTAAGNAALTAASYGKAAAMYQAFQQLNPLAQDKFLINDVYFNELQQAALPTSPSYLQYFRGYEVVNTLFPAAWGYTNDLAVYTTDPATISADHPQGVPTRNIVNGQPEKAQQVQTGNADLRLATLQTASGGNLTIVGPGGTFIAGSVVRTATQAADRVTRFGVDPTSSLMFGQLTNANAERISAIPIGYEGILTLNGGAIDSFTDGSFLVNQSRVFTEAGGNITMWSSNGDLNAGQGPRSASNFPPVTVSFDLDGFSQVDSAGSVSGAGIGAFQRSPTDPTSSIILIAPAGLVDAGDAGVRATGDVLVAAARVANADAFSAGGNVSGVPAHAATPSAATPSSAASAIAAQVGGNTNSNDNADRPSIITVEVLGYVGTTPSCDDSSVSDPACRAVGN